MATVARLCATAAFKVSARFGSLTRTSVNTRGFSTAADGVKRTSIYVTLQLTCFSEDGRENPSKVFVTRDCTVFRLCELAQSLGANSGLVDYLEAREEDVQLTVNGHPVCRSTSAESFNSALNKTTGLIHVGAFVPFCPSTGKILSE